MTSMIHATCRALRLSRTRTRVILTCIYAHTYVPRGVPPPYVTLLCTRHFYIMCRHKNTCIETRLRGRVLSSIKHRKYRMHEARECFKGHSLEAFWDVRKKKRAKISTRKKCKVNKGLIKRDVIFTDSRQDKLLTYPGDRKMFHFNVKTNFI